MRGRRTPTKIKQLQGTVEKSRLIENEVSYSPVDGLPDPPDYFGKIATKRWYELGQELSAVGLLEKTDIDSLTAFCVAVETMHNAAEKMKTDPKAFRLWRDAVEKMMGLSARFGFDPASRTKVGAGKQVKEVVDPYEAAVSGVKMKVAK